jgi:CDP-diacylglycerol--glycerol-3-phosphate 3-phosphatidyltransferase
LPVFQAGQPALNLPNQLTVSRFVLTALFLAVMFAGFPGHESVALLLFSLAGISDFLDGRIARQRGLITQFGILMDPLADKILTCSAFIAFVGRGLMPAWMVVIIVARELAITGLRLLAASQQVVLAAERYGKHKTISQIVAIVAVLTVLSYPQWGVVGEWIFGWRIFGMAWPVHVAVISKWVAVGLTLFSGGVYLWRNRALYLKDM